MCLSYTSPRPHILTMFTSGKVIRDCRNNESLAICAHSVAVADTSGCLLKLINWYKSIKQSTNLWKLSKSSSSMPKHPGAKPHQTQKRSKSKSIPVLTRSNSPFIEPPTTISSTVSVSSSVATECITSLPTVNDYPVFNGPYHITAHCK